MSFPPESVKSLEVKKLFSSRPTAILLNSVVLRHSRNDKSQVFPLKICEELSANQNFENQQI